VTAEPSGSTARLERVLVWLIAAHSYFVGVLLLLAPRLALDLGGFAAPENLFFPRQGGAFHVVLATGYLLEYGRTRGVALLVSAKILAAVFLVTVTFTGDVPWSVPFSGLIDFLMGITVLGIRHAIRRERGGGPVGARLP
jgi:hypothetical protein